MDAVYEQRVLAEMIISRPIMKRFKASIRERGLFVEIGSVGDSDD